jgi:AcrR family transcriptional regulator
MNERSYTLNFIPMPKSTNQKEVIVQTALKLFATRGYGNTPVSLIASTAKVSQGLMYNFFISKKDLLLEIMTRGFADIRESLAPYHDPQLNPQQAIEAHVNKTFNIIKEHSELWRLIHALRLQNKVHLAAKTIFQDMTTDIIKTFSPTFKKLGYQKPDLESLLFLSQIDGLAILYLQDPSIPIAKLSQQLIQRYQK